MWDDQDYAPPLSQPPFCVFSCNLHNYLHFYSTDNHSSPHSCLEANNNIFPMLSFFFSHLPSKASLNPHCPSPFPFQFMNSPQLNFVYIYWIHIPFSKTLYRPVYPSIYFVYHPFSLFLSLSLSLSLYIHIHVSLSFFFSMFSIIIFIFFSCVRRGLLVFLFSNYVSFFLSSISDSSSTTLYLLLSPSVSSF